MGLGWKQNEIIIVGAGLAGLFAALKLAPEPVTVVTSAKLGTGASSNWAQGGIAAAIEAGDTPFAHAFDTMQAGAGIVNPHIATMLADEAAARIEDLLTFGTPFDRNLEGDLLLSQEAAHSHRRVVRVKGDQAGAAIMHALIAAVAATPSIQVVEGFTAKELDVLGNRARGVHVWSKKGEHVYLPARAIVLAAGGCGALYRITTNPEQANGEAMAMAARAGAYVADTEFVQFHPTAIDSKLDPAPLATEALRGEGAVLINAKGERFMKDVHKDAELAPRDIVARAVFRENLAGRRACLDCRKAVGERFPEQFPAVYKKCKAVGIDPVKDPIPVAPAAHFHMGGVFTDASGQTTVEGLWACGEVTSTGAHGANRLASNSLLEAVVFAARVAEDVKRAYLEPFRTRGTIGGASTFARSVETELGKKHLKVVADLRVLMDRLVGIERNKEGLVEALATIGKWQERYHNHLTLINMLTAAKIIALPALMRRESRGSHYRTDYPKVLKKYEKRFKYSLREIDEKTKDALS